MAEYRERIGNFIGASGSEIAIVVNTGAGANVIALGLDWNAGDEVLLCDNEFPANAVPWLALRRRGVRCMLPTQRQRLTPDVYWSRTFASHAIGRAFVEFRMPTDTATISLKLADVARVRGALLCVDAMQGLSAFPLDVREAGVDAVYAGSGKMDARTARRRLSLPSAAPLLERLQLACRLAFGAEHVGFSLRAAVFDASTEV
jgi:selenocysteine lyase/cysteine desulfurase